MEIQLGITTFIHNLYYPNYPWFQWFWQSRFYSGSLGFFCLQVRFNGNRRHLTLVVGSHLSLVVGSHTKKVIVLFTRSTRIWWVHTMPVTMPVYGSFYWPRRANVARFLSSNLVVSLGNTYFVQKRWAFFTPLRYFTGTNHLPCLLPADIV